MSERKGFPMVEWNGKPWIMIGGAIATPEMYRNGETSYAHLFEDGIIRRYGEEIGRKEDLIPIGELPAEEAEPEDPTEAMISLLGDFLDKTSLR